MSGFAYFIPNERNEPSLADRWDEFGLQDSLRDITDLKNGEHATVGEVQRGPEGQAGVIVQPKRYDGEIQCPLGYHEHQQGWMEHSSGKCWIGWSTANLPSPEWLQRRQVHSGYNVRACSGRTWFVPIARSPAGNEYGTLPTVITFNGDEIQHAIQPAFAKLWEISGKAWDRYNTPREDWPEDFTDAQVAGWAVKSISVNYRIDRDEINALAAAGVPMLDPESAKNVILALIDIEAVAEMEKKSAMESGQSQPSSSTSTAGEQAETQASVPVAAK